MRNEALVDPPATDGALDTSEEDKARSGVYDLLGALLRASPGEDLLARVANLSPTGGHDRFALAWESLRLSAGSLSANAVDDEFHRLFIGLGRGELVAYGSWYQTGFLMERPLGVLRKDLAELGFERMEGVCEPEDHVAALCEVMAALATDPETSVERQREFFRAHLAPWIERFFLDLGVSEGATFYRAVAGVGVAFFDLERRYLELEN